MTRNLLDLDSNDYCCIREVLLVHLQFLQHYITVIQKVVIRITVEMSLSCDAVSSLMRFA